MEAVTVYVPRPTLTVGMPEMLPVFGSSARPLGSAGETVKKASGYVAADDCPPPSELSSVLSAMLAPRVYVELRRA